MVKLANIYMNINFRNLKKWMLKRKRRYHNDIKQKRLHFFSRLLVFFIIILIVGFIAGFIMLSYFARGLPSPDQLTQRNVPETTKIYSQDGVLLYEIYGDVKRTFVKLDEIPQYLKEATVAVEDKEFYNHQGFDLRGFVRAAFRTLSGERLEGGSTITQQVVKNTLLTQERTITRKIRELILSIEIERRYTKDEILQMYLNEVPYGGQAVGIGAAAEMYFGKSAKDLTLAEATLLAGLPQAPSLYSPCGTYPEKSKERQIVVLDSMLRDGYITTEQKDEIEDTELSSVCYGYSQTDLKAPHFVLFVKSELTKMFGENMVEEGGLRVKTTLDWNLQQIAQEEAVKQIDALKLAKANATNAGIIVVNPKNGQIIAMVGSVDYFDTEHDGNVNAVLSDQLQPGSSIKPLTYLTAFTQGYNPATYVSDIRTCFPGGTGQPDYCPGNWDDKFWGPMSIRTALSNSRNIPAVKMMQVVGIQNMIDLGHKMGITTLNEPERYGLSLTLGGGEVKPYDMAQMFAVMAAMGTKHLLTPIVEITDSKGNVLYSYKDSAVEVVKPEYVYLVNNILSDSNTRKTTFGNSLEIGRPLAVKTGTTNDNKDAWTIGYTPQLVTVVWVGNFNKEPMKGVMGSTGATPIMKGIMTRHLKDRPVENWTRPGNVIEKTVDSLSGLIPQENRGFPTRTDIFVKGTDPVKVDDFHIIRNVCKSDPTKLATQYHIDKGLVEEKVFISLKEIMSAWQPFTNNWMEARKADGYGFPPTENCPIDSGSPNDTNGPLIELIDPLPPAQTTNLEIYAKVKVYTTERITKVEFYWDDVLILTTNSEPYEVTIKLANLEAKYKANGIHSIKVSAYDSLGQTSSLMKEVLIGNAVTITPTPIGVPIYISPTLTPTITFNPTATPTIRQPKITIPGIIPTLRALNN